MHRCKYNLDKLAQNKHQMFSLIIMDEIFSSTNPVEAVAGAFAVCKKMASYATNILIFTTHFNYLTKLAKDPTHSFVNYRMGTHHNELTNDIQFTYKIEKGVNKHLLALELLKKTGFDSDILDDAINIKKLLLKPKS
jgi:DNA mismatch repair ATPase MutS